MDRFSQGRNRRIIGFFTIFFGIVFMTVVISIFATTAMSFQHEQINDIVEKEFGGQVEIEFYESSSFESEDSFAFSVVKYLFIGVGLIIIAVGVYWVISSYKIERYERRNMNLNMNSNMNMEFNPYVNRQDSMDYSQNYEQTRTYNLNGKVYDSDDNSLGL